MTEIAPPNAEEPEPAPVDNVPSADQRTRRLRVFLIVGAIVIVVLLFALHAVAKQRENHVPVSAAPKPVTVIKAQPDTYRPRHDYVGTIEPWSSAKVGPQFVSAYVGTVLVRPGALVKRGDILATLDCRSANAASRETASQAEAMANQQVAIAHETERTEELKRGGFASANEVEQLAAKAASDQARVQGLKASLSARSLSVSDCILRAPFDGEVADRYVDPGAYVRPGEPVVQVVDRKTVRVAADAPEEDFAVVAPGAVVEIKVAAVGMSVQGTIIRRSPAADELTRTVHFEIDLDNAERKLPVGTTARMTIEVGSAKPASRIPLRAASVRQTTATVFVVQGDIVKRQTAVVMGERNGELFVETTLAPGSLVVLEGRALLNDNDRVHAEEAK